MAPWLRPKPRAVHAAKAPDHSKRVRSVAVPRPGALLRPRAALLRPKARRAGAVFKSGSVREWVGAESDGFKGMQVVRPQAWDIQGTVDGLHDAGVFGKECCLRADVLVGAAGEPLRDALRSSAARLLAPLVGFGLPAGLVEQVKQDAEEIGVAVAELLPATHTLNVKLELMRENVCVRWHQDHYAARAIVSYNCSGTEYIHDDHVDFWELNNCGNNDCVVRDRTHVCQAGVGDVLLIKGKMFPGIASGLVHRSPDHSYHPDGVMKTRLVLKVDARHASHPLNRIAGGEA